MFQNGTQAVIFWYNFITFGEAAAGCIFSPKIKR